MYVDRTVPAAVAGLRRRGRATGYTCTAAGADAHLRPGRARLQPQRRRLDPGRQRRPFAVAKGTVRVRALDVAGNQALTGAAR